MKKDFNCPSCNAPMNFDGGESIFQTCQTCNAPIVVPSDIFYPKDKQILSENFATLANDIAVDPEQVTNELTPGSKPPLEKELINREAKIEKFEVYQEKIGTSPVAVKEAFDELVNPGENSTVNISDDSILKIPGDESAANILERIRKELKTGDRVDAIRIFRDEFGASLEESIESVDQIEKNQLTDVFEFVKGRR